MFNYDNSQIVEKIKSLAKSKGLSINDIQTALEVGENYLSQAAKGKEMSSIKLAKIADMLGCSVDYLLGRTETDLMEVYQAEIKEKSEKEKTK